MTQNSYDVIIVGAGASGLMAAWELVLTGKKVAVVEARERTGGRIHTIIDPQFSIPVELGAEFVHGKLQTTLDLLQKAGIATGKVTGDIWQKEKGRLQKQEDFIEDYSHLEKKFKELHGDIPVATFIDQYLQGEKEEELRTSLKNYVEGYYAADIARASTRALCQELTTSDDVQYRVEGGYQQLIDYLHRHAQQKGCSFYLSNPVQQIHWQENKVEVITDKQSLGGRKVLITVPLGVLQSEQLSFTPALPEKMAAAKSLGFGPVIKILLQFENAFWKQEELTKEKGLDKMGFVFSREPIPTWWTQHPKDVALLTGWLAGPRARVLQEATKEEILNKALQSLKSIFNTGTTYLQRVLKGWHVANWATDIYNCGGYAYDVVNGSLFRNMVKEPVGNTVFFAGEALFEGPEIGTVEAALITGREAAHQMIASF